MYPEREYLLFSAILLILFISSAIQQLTIKKFLLFLADFVRLLQYLLPNLLPIIETNNP